MKKLLFAVIVLLASTVCSQADELSVTQTVNTLPTLKEGIMVRTTMQAINITTLEVAKYKGFSINGGLVGADGVCATITYDLSKLAIKGLEVFNYLDVGYGVGVKTITLNTDKVDGDNRVVNGIVVQAKLKF